MANSYGGIVLVGVADDRSLVGVPEAEQVSIVNACHDTLEPPWQPEVIALQAPGPEPLFLLVLRVDHERAPRPILVRGAAPIRLPGRAATANRGQLRQLSRGASLIVNPSNDLRVPMERASQVDDFLREIAMDAGLEGREACLSDLHKRAAI